VQKVERAERAVSEQKAQADLYTTSSYTRYPKKYYLLPPGRVTYVVTRDEEYILFDDTVGVFGLVFYKRKVAQRRHGS
jgi:hypothetical protein